MVEQSEIQTNYKNIARSYVEGFLQFCVKRDYSVPWDPAYEKVPSKYV